MVGGFNTNIRYRGRVFHIQTEDGGVDHPNIITLLYEGGAILFSKKSSYAEQLEAADDLELEVRQMMEEQHGVMVQALKAGRLDEKVGLEPLGEVTDGGTAQPAEDPFGTGVITERPLDEVILAHFVS